MSDSIWTIRWSRFEFLPVPFKESHEILVNEFGFPKRHFNQEGAMKSWAMDLEIAAEKKGFEQGIEQGIERY